MVWDALQDLGIIAFATGAAGLVLRYGLQEFAELVEQGIDQFFDKEIARQKAKLEHDRVIFTRLHQERASVIIELYRRFVRFERDMRALTTGLSSDDPSAERFETATASGNHFVRYYMEHKIYFPPDTCEAVENLEDEMTDIFIDFRAGNSDGGPPAQRVDLESRLANWQDVTRDEVPELKRELENHFRELLGVDSE